MLMTAMLMKMEWRPASVHGHVALRQKRFLHIRNGKGRRILVREGEVWITQERDGRDYILGPGAQFEITRDGLTLIHACQPSVITALP